MNFYVYKNIENKIKETFNEIKPNLSEFNKSDCNLFFPGKIRLHFGASSENSLFINNILCYDNPKKINDVDFFIVPIAINIHKNSNIDLSNLIVTKIVEKLDYFSIKKHVFFMVGDNYNNLEVLKNSIVFMTSCNKKKSKAIPLHYSLENENTENKNIINCKYDLFFQGCINCNTRLRLKKEISKIKNLNIFFKEQCKSKNKESKIEYLKNLQKSKFVLCPKGFGLNSIRFFESICYGRIPIIISDEIELPLEKKINYKSFSIKVSEKKIDKIPFYIEKFLSNNDINKASEQAIAIWKEYFQISNINFFLQESINNYFKNNLIYL